MVRCLGSASHCGAWLSPDTDDMRDSPSRALMEALWAAGVKVKAYDPQAIHEYERIYGERADLMLCNSREEVAEGADALVISMAWKAFRTVDTEWLKQSLNYPIVVDGRNLCNPVEISGAGIFLYVIGRESRPLPDKDNICLHLTERGAIKIKQDLGEKLF